MIRRAAPHPDELAMAQRLKPHAARASALVAARVADARAHAAHGHHKAAADRLDELAESLGGADGLVRSARTAFYRSAIGELGLSPEAGEETVVRTARIGGREAPGARTTRAIGDAKRGLRLETNAGAVTHESLAAWASRHARSIEAAARGELSDSQMGIHNAIYQISTRGIDGQETVQPQG